MSEALITVFTPTYNRCREIQNCYNSLRKQTSFNFEWLIIDDGSTDQTEETVKKWTDECSDFKIRYFYKENGGLHTAYNWAIERAETELFVCIDSDDWMPAAAVEAIERLWESIDHAKYAGIMGIDRYEDGRVVGDAFPENVREMYLYEKLVKYKLAGDKKMIHRTALLKKVAPMPSFNNEKFFNPSYLMYQLDRYGKLYVTNECFCIVNYQPDGMSSNIYKQYRTSPRSYAEYRKLYLSFPDSSFLFKFKNCIHYVSSCILNKTLIEGIKEVKGYRIMMLFAILPGYLLTALVLWKTRGIYD